MTTESVSENLQPQNSRKISNPQPYRKRYPSMATHSLNGIKKDQINSPPKNSYLPVNKSEQEIITEDPDIVIRRYGIRLYFPINIGNLAIQPKLLLNLSFFSGDIKLKPVSPKEKEEAKKKIAIYIQKYPEDFFKRNGIRSFSVLHLKNASGRYYPGHGNITFDILTFEPKTFYHEIFHFLTARTIKGIKFTLEWLRKFPTLTKLQSLLFKLTGKVIEDRYQIYYGNSALKMQLEEFEKTKYVRRYSRASVYEDIATTGEILFSPHMLKAYLEEKSHTRLKEKIEFAMNLYYTLSGDKMNAEYWADLLDRKIDSNYWRNRK